MQTRNGAKKPEIRARKEAEIQAEQI